MLPARVVIWWSAVHDHASEGHSTAQRSVPSLDDESFAMVVAFINGNLSRHISIQDLSALTDISRHHFSRRFKKKTGLSPYAFLTISRMECAKKLFIETSFSQEEIAEQVGFSHVGHFRKQFRKHFDLSPSDIREKSTTEERLSHSEEH